MNLKSFIAVSCCLLRLALVPIVALSLVAASVATASADSQSSATRTQGGVKYTKKYVKIVGSNIPVPVWVAEGPLPKTTYPVRSYDYNEISKIPGAYTPAQVLANDPSITITGRH
jgi:hypothetical protein